MYLLQYLGTNKRCCCGAINCKKILGRHANARGLVKCGACQKKILDAGVSEEVLLHPQLSTPVCQECSDALSQINWSESAGKCQWCCSGETSAKMVVCASCSKYFCKQCLRNNLGAAYIKLAEHGTWSCLLCDSRPLDRIRGELWVAGEPEPPVITTNPGASAAARSVRPGGVRGVRAGTPRASAIRAPMTRAATPMTRAATPRSRGAVRMVSTPPSRGRGGGRVGTPWPVRMLGQSGVSIERVARPAQPAQRSVQAAAIINQLQRYRSTSLLSSFSSLIVPSPMTLDHF